MEVKSTEQAARTEQFRRECEARYILGLPFDERRPRLDGIEAARGKAARRYLEEDVLRQHKIMRGQG